MPVDRVVICRNFMQLHDAFKSHGDSIQKLIDQIVADLKALLEGPFLTEFTDNWDKATTIDEQRRAVQTTGARIEKLLQSIAGTPLVAWPPKALELLDHLRNLLRALKSLRENEKAMGTHVAVWCG